MNIIQVCPYDLSIPGGVQTHVTHLSNQLVQGNHKLMVFAPISKKKRNGEKFDCTVHEITKAKRIKIWGTSIDISYLSKSDKAMIKDLMNEFSPDVIHFHTIWNPFMQFQLLNMMDKSVKKIATFHDTPPDFGIGKVIGGNMMKLGRWYFLKRLDAAISVSKSQANAMGIMQERLPENFQIIPNGINVSITDEINAVPKKNDKFNIIFIGRLEGRKGIFDLLEVYKRLSEEIGKDEISLTIVGNGPLRILAEKYIADNSIKNINWNVNADDQLKFQLLSSSDLLVAPALYGESFGIVLLEAMAMGVKVVGYGNAGYLNIGREYEVENFPAPGDKQKLYERIKTHIQNPEATSHLVKKGLEIAKKHDWKVVANEIEKMY